jgi:hypothetical protein
MLSATLSTLLRAVLGGTTKRTVEEMAMPSRLRYSHHICDMMC